VGPVTMMGHTPAEPLRRLDDRQAIWRPVPPFELALDEAITKLREVRPTGIPLIVRVAGTDADLPGLVAKLAPLVDLLPVERRTEAGVMRRVVEAAGRPVLLLVPTELPPEAAEEQVAAAMAEGVAGVMQEGSIPAEGGRVYGAPVLEPALAQLRQLRQ